MDEKLRYYMWLAKALGIPSKAVSPLLEVFKTAKAVYEADEEDFAALSFLSKAERSRLCDKSLEPIMRDLAYCDGQGVGTLTYEDEAYPASLREIEAPPLVLYVFCGHFGFAEVYDHAPEIKDKITDHSSSSPSSSSSSSGSLSRTSHS